MGYTKYNEDINDIHEERSMMKYHGEDTCIYAPQRILKSTNFDKWSICQSKQTWKPKGNSKRR